MCCEMTDARSGYVALLSEDGSENEVLFLESGGMPCSVDENLPMPIRGLRSESYRTGKPAYDNNFMNSEWVKYMPDGHVQLKNVMFAPLVIEEKAVGLIGLANKKDDFNNNDARLASGFGEIASVALQNSRTLDQLRDALTKVKKTEEKLKVIATTDELTECYNRRAFNDNLKKNIARAKRYKETFSLFMLDIDNFKAINDSTGHNTGDQILKAFVSKVKKKDIIEVVKFCLSKKNAVKEMSDRTYLLPISDLNKLSELIVK